MTEEQPLKIGSGPDKDFDQILTNPFLDIGARFWDRPRYHAFRVCYRSMRFLDDLVDDRKIAATPISETEIVAYEKHITGWLKSMTERPVREESMAELTEVMDRFAIPRWPWERLCRAMIYDLKHEGFKSFRVFLRYAEGAAIAPASVFTHLCGVRGNETSGYRAPGYDVRLAARPLALFSYLVHIIRDIEKDQARGLNYFADDALRARSLSLADLRRAVENGQITDALRELITDYRHLADHYRGQARQTLDELASEWEPRYRLSLEVIYGLYHLVFERIDPEGGNFTAAELNPSRSEIQTRIETIVSNFRSNNTL